MAQPADLIDASFAPPPPHSTPVRRPTSSVEQYFDQYPLLDMPAPVDLTYNGPPPQPPPPGVVPPPQQQPNSTPQAPPGNPLQQLPAPPAPPPPAPQGIHQQVGQDALPGDVQFPATQPPQHGWPFPRQGYAEPTNGPYGMPPPHLLHNELPPNLPHHDPRHPPATYYDQTEPIDLTYRGPPHQPLPANSGFGQNPPLNPSIGHGLQHAPPIGTTSPTYPPHYGVQQRQYTAPPTESARRPPPPPTSSYGAAYQRSHPPDHRVAAWDTPLCPEPTSHQLQSHFPLRASHQVRPPLVFSGLADSKVAIRDWIKDMAYMLEATHPPPALQFDTIVRYLSHDARKLVDNLRGSARTVQRAFEELELEFGEDFDTIDPLANFYQRTQRPSETPSSYAIVLEALLKDVETKTGLTLSEEERNRKLSTQLFAGLLDQRIRDRLAPMKPQRMLFQDLRRELHAISREERILRKQNSRPRMHQHQVAADNNNHDNMDDLHKQLKQQREQINKLESLVTDMRQLMSMTPPPPLPSHPQPVNRRHNRGHHNRHQRPLNSTSPQHQA